MASILTNNSAMQAAQTLNATYQELAQTQNRISTGLRVSSAKDDGSTYAIAQKMRAEADSWSAVKNSLSRGQSILDVATAAISTIQDVLLKLRKDAVSLNDTSLDDQSRTSIETEMQNLIGQIDQSVNSASFSGVNLLNRPSGSSGGEAKSTITPGPTLSYHLGQDITGLGAWAPFSVGITSAWHISDSDGTITNITVPPMYPSGNGDQHVDWVLSTPLPPGTVNFTFNPPSGYYGIAVEGSGLPPVNVLSDPSGDSISLGSWDLRGSAIGLTALDWTDPQSILNAVENAQQTVTQAGEAIGTNQNSIDTSIKTASTQQDQITAGIGNLVDADMAKESANLQAEQVKQQLGTQTLSMANQQSKWILDLFK